MYDYFINRYICLIISVSDKIKIRISTWQFRANPKTCNEPLTAFYRRIVWNRRTTTQRSIVTQNRYGHGRCGRSQLRNRTLGRTIFYLSESSTGFETTCWVQMALTLSHTKTIFFLTNTIFGIEQSLFTLDEWFALFNLKQVSRLTSFG